jgi:hypothetical protein
VPQSVCGWLDAAFIGLNSEAKAVVERSFTCDDNNNNNNNRNTWGSGGVCCPIEGIDLQELDALQPKGTVAGENRKFSVAQMFLRIPGKSHKFIGLSGKSRDSRESFNREIWKH